MTLQLFVFDMAGTTVRDAGVVLATFLDVAGSYELAADPGWITARMGWSKEVVFRELLRRAGGDAALAERMAQQFHERLAERFEADPPRALPGADDALRALEMRGVRAAFSTGFARATADLLLDRLGWSHYLSVASDEVDHGRPSPDLILETMRRAGVAEARAVGAAGDTPSDLVAATAAGCRLVIGVGTGSHTLGQLREHPHTHLLPDLSTLGELVDSVDF